MQYLWSKRCPCVWTMPGTEEIYEPTFGQVAVQCWLVHGAWMGVGRAQWGGWYIHGNHVARNRGCYPFVAPKFYLSYRQLIVVAIGLVMWMVQVTRDDDDRLIYVSFLQWISFMLRWAGIVDVTLIQGGEPGDRPEACSLLLVTWCAMVCRVIHVFLLPGFLDQGF